MGPSLALCFRDSRYFLVDHQKASDVEIVVLKYEAANVHEFRDLANLRFSFGFCVCSRESTNPEGDSECKCRRNLAAKTVRESAPKAMYSASCLHKSEPSKCLSAKIFARPSKFLYTTVSLNGEFLTSPAWQSITVSRHKTTARLAAKNASRHISLTYAVFSSDSGSTSIPASTEQKQVKPPYAKHEFNPYPKKEPAPRTALTTQWRRPMTTALATTRPTTTAVAARREPASPVLPLQAPALEWIVGETFPAIHQWLMRLSAHQRVHPTAFEVQRFKQAVVQIHNRYRRRHDADDVDHDPSAERAAEAWAANLANRKMCLNHDPVRNYGENMFYFGFEYFTDPISMAEAAVKSFYIEGRGYNYNGFTRDFYRTGHFTQLIWRATRRVGVGVAIRRFEGHRTNQCMPTRPAYLIYIVVKYDPKGNVLKREAYLDNVRPARG
ncbi:Protein C07A4.2 [Aphelenchoides avenae]|nr:Protein C07A4.2 [Aphelenchus avenae]